MFVVEYLVSCVVIDLIVGLVVFCVQCVGCVVCLVCEVLGDQQDCQVFVGVLVMLVLYFDVDVVGQVGGVYC